ncbi:aa3-type cytochrome oxidase subunit IV [Streptomyces halobius]|uniref:cytochrome-c oxidase n=1 Tax=Streptomyces halobius TaxID=2879846 RepID=A0ABY4LZA5_9ACTN|nr:cytochrome c oxidase subunit 4 [Streptomyces halobius]UQA90834.1 cytochrome c oxidase subunit 4 [Streptomyces halobius]
MKIETYLFGGVALFFAVTALGYAWWSELEPVGTAALIVSFLMSALIFVYFGVQRHKHGSRPEDHKTAEIQQRSGPVDFFPPRSIYPFLTALGYSVGALGVVFGAWLFLIGVGLVAGSIFGFVFQYAERES